MKDISHLAKLSGFLPSDSFLSDMEDIINLMDKITETNFPPQKAAPESLADMREDKPSSVCKDFEIRKSSKAGLEIPKIM